MDKLIESGAGKQFTVSVPKPNMTTEEARLINYCRELGWGKIEVMVKSGKPVMIQVERRDIKLTD